MNNTIYDACVDAVNRNAMELMAQVDEVIISKITDGTFQVDVTHDCMATDPVVCDRPADAIVIACSRALNSEDDQQ